MTVIRNELDVAKIILQVADQLNSKGKGYIKEIVDATIALPESAKKQATEAQTLIANGNKLKAELQKQADDANERLAIRERAVKVREAAVEDAKALKAEAEAIAAKNKEDAAALKKRADELTNVTLSHAETTKKHASILADIAEKSRLLNIENKKLEDKRKEIADYEAQVTGAAEEMSGLVKAKLVKKAR